MCIHNQEMMGTLLVKPLTIVSLRNSVDGKGWHQLNMEKPEAMRQFSRTHISENCSENKGVHENELFFDCTFNKLNGLTLKDCDLNRSKFVTKSLRDALGLTLTLDCHSFSNVEYSEELFDMMLALLTMTKGNDEKRSQLIEVIGQKKYQALNRLLKATE